MAAAAGALEELEFLSLQGVDKRGDGILSIVGKSIPGKAVPPEVLAEYVEQGWREALEGSESALILVYFHAGFQWEHNCPSLLWLHQLCARLPDAFLGRVRSVYIVHPTVGLRASLFLLSPWMPQSFSSLYSKVVFVSRVEFLDEYVDISRDGGSAEMEIPEFVLDHDQDVLEQHPLWDYGFQLDPVLAQAQVVGEVPSSEAPSSELHVQ